MPALRDTILEAPIGPRPMWSRDASTISVLIARAQGDLALKAGADVVDKYALERGVRVEEVVRVQLDANHEGIYARVMPLDAPQPEEPLPPLEQVQELSAQVERATNELSEAMTGQKP